MCIQIREMGCGIFNTRQSDINYFKNLTGTWSLFYLNITHGGPIIKGPSNSRPTVHPWLVRHQ